MSHPEVTIDYTSASSADTTAFSAANPARCVYAYGAGSIVLLDAGGTSRTYTVNGGEDLMGEWTAFTSTTCSRIRISTVATPPRTSPAFSTTVPGTSLQTWADGGAAATSGFTVAPGTLYKINPNSITFVITFPAISASNAGQRVGLVNVATSGTTATILTPNGSDSFGNSAAATAATAAGPTAGLATFYTADNTVHKWLTGV
jgi:hypothetical protein